MKITIIAMPSGTIQIPAIPRETRCIILEMCAFFLTEIAV